MSYPTSERVGAFIIRKNANKLYELLLFRHLDHSVEPVQIPGGGIEFGESIEAALHREVEEESGLVNLPVLRKLGICERCWLDTRATARRHYFLLEAPDTTPDRWLHIVQGNGKDAGLRFSFFWHRPAIEFKLLGGAQLFMNPHFLPELYDAKVYSLTH